jgi:hypothetical protein
MQLRTTYYTLKKSACDYSWWSCWYYWVHCKLMNLQIILRFQA